MFSKYFIVNINKKKMIAMTRITGSLTFVGLGLYDTEDLCARGLLCLQKSDTIFAEFYTSKLGIFDKKKFEYQIGKTITILTREQTETGDDIINTARSKHVALLACGDPMTATTHVDLRLRAAKNGVPTHIVHASSILTAAPGLLGLQAYKFSRSTTLAYPQKNFFPTSPYDIIKTNLTNGLHTLVFLDIQADNNVYMTANDGLRLLLEMGEKLNDDTLNGRTLACVVARAGSDQPLVAADEIDALIAKDFGAPLHILVIPGALHFIEVEALSVFAGLPPKLAAARA